MSDRIKRARLSKKELSAESVARLIQATIDCIVNLSYAKTTTVQIVEFAGLTRGALQHHYDSREDLILATWTEVHARFLARFDATSETSAKLEDRVNQMVEKVWDLYISPEYLVATEIRLGTRADIDFSKQLQEALINFNIAYEEKWQSAFDGLASPEKIEQAKRVIGGALRGLAIQRVSERDKEYYASSLVTCKQMLLSYLSR